jgi:hypothetical protein
LAILRIFFSGGEFSASKKCVGCIVRGIPDNHQPLAEGNHAPEAAIVNI